MRNYTFCNTYLKKYLQKRLNYVVNIWLYIFQAKFIESLTFHSALNCPLQISDTNLAFHFKVNSKPDNLMIFDVSTQYPNSYYMFWKAFVSNWSQLTTLMLQGQSTLEKICLKEKITSVYLLFKFVSSFFFCKTYRKRYS